LVSPRDSLEIDPPTVRELVERLGGALEVRVVAGEDGLDTPVLSAQIQKPGLILAGLFEYLDPRRIQIIGRSETSYLKERPVKGQRVCRRLCDRRPPAFLVTLGNEPPPALVEGCRQRGIPLLRTPRTTGDTIELLYHFLAVRLAPTVKVHGVLVDVFGLGTLIIGESGIGKSECALDLVTRGHRLVADDTVEIKLIEGELLGSAPDVIRDTLEVRGVGLINPRQMFGITAVRETKVIEQAVRLVPLNANTVFDRLGERGLEWECLGRSMPLLELPVAPGRNLAVLIEITARRRLLQDEGYDAYAEVRAAMAKRMIGQPPPPPAEERDS
jgi:HPr kinase/phosphorylase